MQDGEQDQETQETGQQDQDPAQWEEATSIEKKDDEAHASMEMDLALGNPTEVESWDNELWLGDTGASCHMTNTLEGMKNLIKINT